MSQIVAGLYELKAQIGSGGGGIVYLGRHIRLGKDIVLKADKRSLAVGEDVLRRESFSSTAFTDVLAVPHAISRYADRSFIGVIHNDAPIPWSGRTVRFVLLVGIAEQDMKHFKAAFDLIIDLFSSPERTLELLRTDTFEEFCSLMK